MNSNKLIYQSRGRLIASTFHDLSEHPGGRNQSTPTGQQVCAYCTIRCYSFLDKLSVVTTCLLLYANSRAKKSIRQSISLFIVQHIHIQIK